MSDDKPKDGLMQLMESDETAKELAEAKAAQDKLEADEKALEADPKVKLSLLLEKVGAVADDLAPLLEVLPEPERTIAVDLKDAIEFAVAEIEKL